MSDNQNNTATTTDNSGKGKKDADKRKQSLYFPDEMLQEMQVQAARLDRSLSWVMQRAWKVAKQSIEALPSMNEE